MDKGKYEKLNKYHVIFLVQNTMVGFSLLALPKSISSLGYNEWLIPLIFGVVANITLIPIVMLMRRYPQDSLFEINVKLLGKWIGKLFNLAILIYCLLQVAYVANGYLRLMQASTLENRSVYGPSFVFFVILLYLIYGGIKSLGRFAIISFFMTIWMMYFLLWPIQKGDIRYLMPHVFIIKPEQVLSAFYQGYTNMLGYETLLFFFPYIIHKKNVLKHASIGIWINVLIFTLISMVSVMYFSEWQLEHLAYPILNIYSAVKLSFIERIENVGISIWVFLILSTTSVYLWAAKKGMDSVLNLKKTRHLYISVILISLTYIQTVSKFLDQFIYPNNIYFAWSILLWPIFLLMVHKLRKSIRKALKEQRHEES